LQEEIGAGGMGTVFRAIDTALERPVAVKRINPDFLLDKQAGERFLSEARLTAGIRQGHGSARTIGAYALGGILAVDRGACSNPMVAYGGGKNSRVYAAVTASGPTRARTRSRSARKSSA